MICRSLKFFLRALDFAFFECFYYMKAIPFSMNLENRIAAPSRSSGGKRLPFGLAGQSQEHINTDGNRMRDDPPGAIMILP